MGELNTSRRSEDIERVRKGVEYELERALRLAGHPWEGHRSPGPVIGDYKGETVAVDEELPFEDSYAAWTPEQRRTLYENFPKPKPPCGKADAHCGFLGGSARCGGCRN